MSPAPDRRTESCGAARGPARRRHGGQLQAPGDDEVEPPLQLADNADDLGYRAIEAEDGAVGLQVLQSDARIDLLVTDVVLPAGMNGQQTADAGLLVRPDLKVLSSPATRRTPPSAAAA